MSCAACQHHVERALRSVPGVDSATVNLLANSAQITSTNPLEPQPLIEAVRHAGYDASLPSETETIARRLNPCQMPHGARTRPARRPQSHRRRRRDDPLHAVDDGQSQRRSAAEPGRAPAHASHARRTDVPSRAAAALVPLRTVARGDAVRRTRDLPRRLACRTPPHDQHEHPGGHRHPQRLRGLLPGHTPRNYIQRRRLLRVRRPHPRLPPHRPLAREPAHAARPRAPSAASPNSPPPQRACWIST